MHEFTKQQIVFLKSLGKSHDGEELKELLRAMMASVSDVSSISGDYGAQVEGRKLAKLAILQPIIDALESKDPRVPGVSDHSGEYE